MATFRELLSQAETAIRRFWQQYAMRLGVLRATSDATSEKSLQAGLISPEPRRRWQAATSLGRNPLRSPETIAALINTLADPEPIVRWHAAEALAAQEAGRVFPALAAALADPEPLRRAGAAEALGRLGGEASGLVLQKHLDDPNPDVRAAVTTAVAAVAGPTADPAVVSVLLPHLNDPHPDVRRAAASALGRMGNATAAVTLAQALAIPDQPLLVRRALAAALARAPHPDAQAQLIAALTDPDPQVRGYAARALGQIGDETAHGPLEMLVADKSRLLRGTVSDRAARALTLLERRGRRATAAKPAEEER